MSSEPEFRRAERARTTLVSAPVLQVSLDGRRTEDVGVHAVDADGSLVLLVPAAGMLGVRMGCGGAVTTAHAARLLPLAVPDRVLERVVVHGRLELAVDVEAAISTLVEADPGRSPQVVLREDPAVLLRLCAWQVRLDGEPIDPDAYVGAAPDPIALGSDAVIGHLLRSHAHEMVELAHLVDRELLDAAWTVAPVLVDRWGVTFQVDHPDRMVRTRIDFPAPLRAPAELPAAMQALQARAARAAVAAHRSPPAG